MGAACNPKWGTFRRPWRGMTFSSGYIILLSARHARGWCTSNGSTCTLTLYNPSCRGVVNTPAKSGSLFAWHTDRLSFISIDDDNHVCCIQSFSHYSCNARRLSEVLLSSCFLCRWARTTQWLWTVSALDPGSYKWMWPVPLLMIRSSPSTTLAMGVMTSTFAQVSRVTTPWIWAGPMHQFLAVPSECTSPTM